MSNFRIQYGIDQVDFKKGELLFLRKQEELDSEEEFELDKDLEDAKDHFNPFKSIYCANNNFKIR